MSKITDNGVELSGVPETMLWTLHNRATEAMRKDRILDDPKSIEIYQSIKFDYEGHFGKAEPSHALRSLAFDRAVREFIQQNPSATIINLGEGLETQRFRCADLDANWISVDVEDAIAVRERFIEPDDRHRHVAGSALDPDWMDFVPKNQPSCITAQGLFMYFQPSDVKRLIGELARRFPESCLMFDTLPRWLSRKTMSSDGWKKSPRYTTPPMPWGINRNELSSTIREWTNDRTTVTDVGYPNFPRGLTRPLFWFFSSMPVLRNITPSIARIHFQS
ncbi:MAG: class I SAM-dependent methyltransferase [Planctomycetota bacterium]